MLDTDLEKDYQESLKYLVNLTTFGMNFWVGAYSGTSQAVRKPGKIPACGPCGGHKW